MTMFTKSLWCSMLPTHSLHSVVSRAFITTSTNLPFTQSPCSIPPILSTQKPALIEQQPPSFQPRHPALRRKQPPPLTAPLVEPELLSTTDSNITTLLPLLRSQPPFYSTVHIQGKSYLITQGDSIRLPFLMQGVEAGDVIRLNRAMVIGSRDYTLKAGTKDLKHDKQKYLDERLFTIRARVTGEVQEPERLKIWHVKRRRHKKHIWSQHKFTVLRITELSVHDASKI